MKKRKKGNILSKIKEFLKDNKRIIIMILPFFLMELFIFLFGLKISYFNYRFYSVILFDVCWIGLFVGISLCFKKPFGKIFYIIFNIIFIVMFIVNLVYFSIMKNFFDFNLLLSASEGAPYVMDALKNCSIFVYLSIIIVIVSLVFSVKKMPVVKENDFRKFGILLLSFVIVHTIVPYTLGFLHSDLNWSNWKNPREIYNSFNDNNKSIKVSGFYEYVVRNFYITFLKTDEQLTEEDITFLNEAFSDTKATKNMYTSSLKGKNLILVQLEGTDNWLITKEDTPTLYSMMNQGYNFTNHYSFYNGGGSTFNSEFAVNTGFVTPFSYVKNAYMFNKNDFPYTLAKMFKNEGYSVNAFHMNSGEYYSRKVNYKNWGYDDYYGLMEIGDYSDTSYQLDRELILNEKFNQLLFPSDSKFVDYIITYSGHLPFTNTKGVCKMLYDLDVSEQMKKNPDAVIEFKEMTEEQCVRRQAKETDYMMKLLIENLKQKNLLKNTAIVVFTDHYLYTLEDESLLKKYKTTSNNLINKTPFFIWYDGIKSKKTKKVTSQLNILPTVLNLYGFKYNPNNYIGKDAFSKDYSGVVFFNDFSWYDGNVYVENGKVVNNKKISESSLEEKNYYINTLIRKNDLTLKYNFFKEMKKGTDK